MNALLKIQGGKYKIVNFIKENIYGIGKGCKWVEPFLGSGVVLLNVQPENALVSDTNPYIIRLYQKIYNGEIDENIIKDFLTEESEKLIKKGESYYYEVRDRFNTYGSELDFFFLNKTCYNGVIRFNKKKHFNAPFCRDVNILSKDNIVRISKNVRRVRMIMKDKNWSFKIQDWKETVKEVNDCDFVYLDPPYFGRIDTYYTGWSKEDNEKVIEFFKTTKSKCMLSNWLYYGDKVNEYIKELSETYPTKILKINYNVNSNKEKRKKDKVTEVIIMNYEIVDRII